MIIKILIALLFLGLYIFSPQFRHITNIIVVTILKIATWIVVHIERRFGNPYFEMTRVQGIPTQQEEQPVKRQERRISEVKPKRDLIEDSKIKVVKNENGESGLNISENMLQELLKNEYIKIEEKS